MALGSAFLLAEASCYAPLVQAREAASYYIDIPAGPLGESLARFSERTGISVGLPGDIPRINSHRVKGVMSPDVALRHMLKGSGLTARRVGGVYRIEKAARAAPDRLPALAPSPVLPQPDIIVTAQKRPQILASVPLSVSIITLDRLTSGARASTSRDIGMSTEGLAMTNLGPGRNRQFIRGVADSPFNGQSQSTVAVQIDEARVTFDAPDPDLRLIDVDRVEILKGPQGPLYGSGALGGIYHIVTRRPELDRTSLSVRLSAEGVQHGATGTGMEGVANVPLIEGRLAVRGVGYRFVNAGWIDNADGRRNSNSAETIGLRLALRWLPAEAWTIDAGFALQDINLRDSQYVVSGAKTLVRDNSIAEPTDTDFKIMHSTVEGDVGGLHLLAATSYVDHDFGYALDASAAATSFGLIGAARFTDHRAYSLFNQELRLSSEGVDHWLVGASFLRATTDGVSTVIGQDGVARIVATLARKTSEYAIFGEATWRLFGMVDATLGARLFDSVAEDETSEASGQRALKRSKIILSPSVALSLGLSDRGILYLRYARAMRPGGLAPLGEMASGRFDSDELSTFDLGIRHASADGRLSLSTSTYYSQWSEIQSDFLLPNGLISTRNAGRGRIYGVEAALDWQLGWGLSVTVGGAAQRARLTHGQDGVELDDLRLPVTPGLSGRLSLAKQVALGPWRGQATVQANYIGSARLSFDSNLDRAMGEYAVLGAHSELTRGPWAIGARLDNLLDVKGDSFAFGNPFSIREHRQFTPIRPRTLTLWVARNW